MKLIEPTIEYKEKAIEYIEEFYKYNSPINGTGGLDRYLDNYEEWLIKVEKDKTCKEEGRVPALTKYLIREEDNKIIGMINIRLELNEYLIRCGGNIGYSIRPTERQKGYNKINLYLALKICYEYGINEVYLDCNKDNLGSKKTMEALGGICINEYYDEHYGDCLKYKINTLESINKYRQYDQEEPKKMEV